MVALGGCLASSSDAKSMVSSDVGAGKVQLGSFSDVLIFDSASASFIELELAQLFEEQGFRVVGEKAVSQPQRTLGVRYTQEPLMSANGRFVRGMTLTILLEQFSTDKTLVTIRGSSRNGGDDKDAAWEEVRGKLLEVLDQYR